MYFWRYINFDTDEQGNCCGVCDSIDLARAWAKKTWERQSAKGSCRVELCEIDTQLHATDLAYALHNTDSKISMLAQVIERWER